MTFVAAAERDWNTHGVSVRIGRTAPDGKFSHLIGLTFKTYEMGQIPTDDAVIKGEDGVAFMQAIMDAAYEFGLRPSKAVDETDVREHLKDARQANDKMLDALITIAVPS